MQASNGEMTFGILLSMGMLLTVMSPEQFASERQLLLFGIDKNPSLVQQQIQLLNSESKGVQERSLTITIVKGGDSRIKKYSINPGQFTVLLIGKDNSEKYRTNDLLPPDQLFGIIDAMPMRKAEMESGNK